MKLLIADDHAIFRKGLRFILETSLPEATIIETTDGDETWKKIMETKPDVAILDIDMPNKNGLDICKLIKENNYPIKTIILTMYKEREVMNKAFLNGAMGYVVKDNSVNEIVACVESVMMDRRYVGATVGDVMDGINELDKKKDKITQLLSNLTQAELKTLKLVSNNKSSKEIAELLFVSVKTIENYRSRICKKLELDPRNNSLLLWVMENKDILNSIRDL
jgi:DNA-binding NarL/FixJ family response regulator